VTGTSKRYEREGRGLSFDRVAFFTDAVFAIALTLIVVGIGVPTLTDAGSNHELANALWDQRSELVSFFVGVLVIGFYWWSHHTAFDGLAAVDGGYVGWTIIYLAFVAFLPYPIRLIGTYDENPVAWWAFALNLALVSGMETVLLVHAQRAGLRADRPGPKEMRWERLMSLLPVPIFVGSVALALISPWLTLGAWAVCPFLQALATRRFRPASPGE
jgi:uncharacterized membrane protein